MIGLYTAELATPVRPSEESLKLFQLDNSYGLIINYAELWVDLFKYQSISVAGIGKDLEDYTINLSFEGNYLLNGSWLSEGLLAPHHLDPNVRKYEFNFKGTRTVTERVADSLSALCNKRF